MTPPAPKLWQCAQMTPHRRRRRSPQRTDVSSCFSNKIRCFLLKVRAAPTWVARCPSLGSFVGEPRKESFKAPTQPPTLQEPRWLLARLKASGSCGCARSSQITRSHYGNFLFCEVSPGFPVSHFWQSREEQKSASQRPFATLRMPMEMDRRSLKPGTEICAVTLFPWNCAKIAEGLWNFDFLQSEHKAFLL